MKAILLVRVSTLGQDYEAQKKDLIEYSKSLGITEYHIIEDKESAIKLSEEERNGLNTMKEWIAKNPDYTNVIVWELSRLARSEKVLHSIKEYFLENQIQLYIYDKKYKLLNDDGKENSETSLLFTLYSYFAESEMKLKKERFQRGKKLNSEKGRFNGGAAVKFGYMLDKDNYIVPEPQKAKIVKDIFELYSSGKYSIRKLRELIEIKYQIKFTQHYLTDMLSFTGYIGYTNIDGVSPSHRKYIPIISESLFNKAQGIKAKNNTCIEKTKKNYHFAIKLLKCKECGGNYYYNAGVYACINYKESTTKTICTNKLAINQKNLDFLLWYLVKPEYQKYLGIDKGDKIRLLQKDLDLLQGKIVLLDSQIAEIDQKIERASLLFINLKIDQKKLDQIIKGLEDEKKEVQKQKDNVESEITSKKNQIDGLQNDLKPISATLSLKEMKDIVQKFISLVTIEKGIGKDLKQMVKIFVKLSQISDSGEMIEKLVEIHYFPNGKKTKYMRDYQSIDKDMLDEASDFWIASDCEPFKRYDYKKIK